MEVWKDVVGYENLYQVSNLGNVKRVGSFRGVNKKYINTYLTPKDNGKGYLRIKLSKDGKGKMFMLHRLISIAFIDNPNNYNVVNHKDSNKLNNNIDNLEWCTQSYNVIHSVNNNRWTQVNKVGKGYFKDGNKYYARVTYKRNTLSLGSYDTEKEAEEIYLKIREIKLTRKFTIEELKQIIETYKQKLKNK